MSQPFQPLSSKATAATAPPKPATSAFSKEVMAVFVCLCLGMLWVGWRAVHRSAAERSLAQDRLQGPAARLQASLSHALSVTEALAVHVRQSSGRWPAFQKVAAELFPAYPGLVSLELLPGGVIMEVAPRGGLEKMIGYSIMRDPNASQAIQLRRLAITGPLRLPNGQVGVMGRLPVFLADAHGRESFWGFVSASVAFPPILSEAKVDQLAAQGYDYLLYVLPPPPQNPVSIVSRGNPPLAKAVDQSMALANLEMRLAVLRTGGWSHLLRLFLETIGVLAGVGFLGYSLMLRKRVAQMETESASISLRLDQETRRAGQLGQQLQTVEESTIAEREAAKAIAESLRGQLRDLENQMLLSREQAGQMEKELRLAKETSAVVLGSARKTAELLQSKLREVELQLVQEKEEVVRLRAQLQTSQDQLNQWSGQAQQNKESLLARWKDTQTELQRSRERVVQCEEELKELARVRREASEQQERSARMESELRTVQEKSTVELQRLHETAEFLQGRISELEVELQSSRSNQAQVEEALRQAQAKMAERSKVPDSVPVSQSQTVTEQQTIPDLPASTDPSVSAPSQVVETPDPSDPIPDATEPISAQPSMVDEPLPAPTEPIQLADTELDSIMDDSSQTAGKPVSEPPSIPVANVAETPKPEKPAPRKRNKDRGQLDLFGEPSAPAESSKLQIKPEREITPEAGLPRRASSHPPAEEKSQPAHLPPFSKTSFKKHAAELYTLLAESDPGAQDCLADTRENLRPAFSPEAFEEFEQLVGTLACPEALQLLVKTARRHGISL